MWEENLAGMTISELKELLKRHDLVRSGTRQQMISRLSISLWRGELLKYESLEKMTVPELKELLKADGKSFAGKKKELIERVGGLTKKEILGGIGKYVYDAVPLALMPSINFHLRDYGINANDPNKTLIGLTKLDGKDLKRLFQQLVVSVHTRFIDENDAKYISSTPQKTILRIMSVVYFGDWMGFPSTSDMMAFLDLELRPNFIMNWVSEDFIQLMRRQGPTAPGVFTLFNQFE